MKRALSFGEERKTGKLLNPSFRVDNMWVANHLHPTIEIKIDQK